ncbi:MAG: hypothetical protein LBQ70_05780 [Prevotellaceae bacterium]|jgi:hypothetical protein|nr:hypothetical protein [Prevotellaceae bacterium]
MKDMQKSRRDNTLLTAGFSLRTGRTPSLTSPAGTTLEYVATKSVVIAGLLHIILLRIRIYFFVSGVSILNSQLFQLFRFFFSVPYAL